MKSMTQSGPTLMYRLAVLSRVVAAIAGGYAISALATRLLSGRLPMGNADAVMTATMLSFAIFTCVVIWVFATRSAWRAWAGLAIITAVLGLAEWLGWGAR